MLKYILLLRTVFSAQVEKRELSSADKAFAAEHVYLARAVSSSAYQPMDDGEGGARFIKDGMIVNNWTASRVSIGGHCQDGRERQNSLCYKTCEKGFDGRGPVCWKNCPSGYVDDGMTCRRDEGFNKKTYDRGIGRNPDCPPGSEKNGALCYPLCSSGYSGSGPVCWQRCRGGYADHGWSCYNHIFDFYFKGSYGRGWGWYPKYCPPGEEFHAGMCYKNCKSGYTGQVTVCYQNCPSKHTDVGLRCEYIHIFGKDSYGRGVGLVYTTFGYEISRDTQVCGHKGWTGDSWRYGDGQEFIVVRNNQMKLTVFGFRGTVFTNLLSWIYNSTILPSKVTIFGERVGIHMGFIARWNSVRNDVKRFLDATPSDHKVIITGHSLGAAVGLIAAPFFKELGREADAVIVFSPPLTADSDFSEMYKKNLGCDKTIKIYAENDIITDIPAVFGFTTPCPSESKGTGWGWADPHDLFRGVNEVIEHYHGKMPTDKTAPCYH